MNIGQVTNRTAILYHIFYEDHIDAICDELHHVVSETSPLLLFNVCDITPDKKNISEKLSSEFPGCIILFSSNKGKDIGGKLLLLSVYFHLKQPCDYLLLLHDKRSLQALKSSRWKRGLMKIIERHQSQVIFNYFDSHKYCGLIAAKEYIVNGNIKDENSTNTNSEKIIEITERYKIAPPSHQFVAGTMFWVRARPFEDFFTKNDPLEIRKSLEDGNVLDNFSGTFTHSWERLFSWIVTSGGYKIHGI